jgi:hypothetical protein
VPLANISFDVADASAVSFAEFAGQWVFVSIDSAGCDEDCARKLYLMRQVRLTQGKYTDRIERVWLINDGKKPTPELLASYQGMHVFPLSDAASLSLFPADVAQKDYIYLVDPMGNLMMRYGRDADPSKMKKDVSKLLRVSSGWRRLDR